MKLQFISPLFLVPLSFIHCSPAFDASPTIQDLDATPNETNSMITVDSSSVSLDSGGKNNDANSNDANSNDANSNLCCATLGNGYSVYCINRTSTSTLKPLPCDGITVICNSKLMYPCEQIIDSNNACSGNVVECDE